MYVHYVQTDKRLDEWVAERDVRPAGGHEAEGTTSNGSARKRKRRSTDGQNIQRGSPGQSRDGEPSGSAGAEEDADEDGARANASVITEEEYDIEHHKQITAKRNFDKVNFGKWQIRTW